MTLANCRIGLYLHQQGIDTTTPAGKAMFQMCGVFAEFERDDSRAHYGGTGCGAQGGADRRPSPQVLVPISN